MISVIIPTFNREITIKRSIDSVLKQTYSDLEVIVIDDCSTDNTRTIIEKIKDIRVRYIYNEHNSGACTSRNRGIELAKGDYIAFQDSDDEWRPNKLSIQLDMMKKYQADVCFGKMMRHNYDKSLQIEYPNLREGIIKYDYLLNNSLVSTQVILAKREVFINCFFDPAMKRKQDWDWTIRSGANHVFCFCEDILADVYLQDDSISKKQTKWIAEEKLYEKYLNLFLDHPQFESNLLTDIAIAKICRKEDPKQELRRAYKIHKNIKTFIRLALAETGVIRFFYGEKTP